MNKSSAHDLFHVSNPSFQLTGFFIQWKETGKWIPVFRPDVECTNGVIHVIDAPLLRDHDITTSGSSSISGSTTVAITLANTVLLSALAFL